jgi:hypothetical protein
VSNRAYEAGLTTFRDEMGEAEAKGAGKLWRAGGRVSKKYPNKEDKTWWLAEGPTMVHKWYNFRMTNPNLDIWHTPEGIPAIELAIDVELPGGVILKSHIDRVMVDVNTNETIIVDLKTGQPPKSGLQLAVYRLAIQQQFGKDQAPRFGSYWMARAGTLDTVYDLEQYNPDMVARWLRDVRKAIDLGIFVPNTNNWCSSCGVKNYCYTQGNMQYAPDFLGDLKEGSDGEKE